MTLFKMQERDLDLFILEELHSDSGFNDWFAERVELKSFRFREAEHSVSAKSNAKWGETDVLAFFSDGAETVAVLIEDKIAAEFTERQAERYRERAGDLVKLGRAQRYVTVLGPVLIKGFRGKAKHDSFSQLGRMRWHGSI